MNTTEINIGMAGFRGSVPIVEIARESKREVYSVADLVEKLGVTRSTIVRWEKNGKLPNMTQLIRTLLITSLVLFIGGCDYLSFCPLEVGDRVVELDTGKEGEIKGFAHWGAATRDCRAPVLFDDGTWSNMPYYDTHYGEKYDSRFVYTWTLKKIEE